MVRINTNLPALTTWRQEGDAQSKGSLTMERLAMGLRVIRVTHDPVNPGISQKMLSQIRGHNQAIQNVQQEIFLLQTAERTLNETHSLLQSIRELIVSAMESTTTSSDRLTIQKAISSYLQEIEQLAVNTHNIDMELDPTTSTDATYNETGQHFSLDSESNPGQNFVAAIVRMDSDTLGISKINVVDPAKVNQSLCQVDRAIEQVSVQRSTLGRTARRLEHSLGNLLTASENLTASESLICEPDAAFGIAEPDRL